MPIVVPPPPNPTAGLHPRLRAAFSVLGYCESVSAGRGRGGANGRSLIPAEIAARNAALELLRHYMTGEVVVDPPPMEIPDLAAIAASAVTGASGAASPADPAC